MLGNAQFYNRTIRKIVTAFGTVLNDIHVARYNKSGTQKYETFKVPLSYGAKEKYLTRITSDPELLKSVATVVPRISFELTGMSYDSGRKQVTTMQNFNQTATGFKTQYAPVPYDFSFSVSIYVRNTEDGTQIIEQILPFFTPDFTVTVDFINEMGKKYDMPIILNSVNTTTDYEGDMMSTRLITWDLEFTVKSFIWPPVKSPTGGLIGQSYANNAAPGGLSYGKVITNLYIDEQDKISQQVKVDYANGNNYFTSSETIRVQGKDDVSGKVVYFSNSNTGVLIVGSLTNLLEPGDVIRGDFSQAIYTILKVDKSPIKVTIITTSPTPNTAEPDDEFGFSETIIQFPDTL
jgi:hypothetical protein